LNYRARCKKVIKFIEGVKVSCSLYFYKDLLVLSSIDRRFSSTRRLRYRLAEHSDRQTKVVK
jgi:hypothetical protein